MPDQQKIRLQTDKWLAHTQLVHYIFDVNDVQTLQACITRILRLCLNLFPAFIDAADANILDLFEASARWKNVPYILVYPSKLCTAFANLVNCLRMSQQEHSQK